MIMMMIMIMEKAVRIVYNTQRFPLFFFFSWKSLRQRLATCHLSSPSHHRLLPPATPRSVDNFAKNMLSVQHRILSVATPFLIAFTISVQAKSSSSSSKTKTKKPTFSSGGGGNTCYDTQFVSSYPPLLILFYLPPSGNEITCSLSKTQWIVIGVIGGQSHI